MFLVIGLIVGVIIIAAIIICIKVFSAASAWEEFNKQNKQNLPELAARVKNGEPGAGRKLENELNEITRKLPGFRRYSNLVDYLKVVFTYKESTSILAAQLIRKHEVWCRNELANLRKLLDEMHEDFTMQVNRRLWSRLMNALEDEQMRKLFCEETDFDIEASTAMVQASINSLYETLCSTDANDKIAYDQLVDLFDEVNGSWGLKRFGITELKYPISWLDRVVACVNNPNLADFAILPYPDDVPRGQCRLRAARALRDDNYTEAKIVLAYCNYNSSRKVHAEVGDILTAELAKLVAAHDKRRAAQTAN